MDEWKPHTLVHVSTQREHFCGIHWVGWVVSVKKTAQFELCRGRVYCVTRHEQLFWDTLVRLCAFSVKYGSGRAETWTSVNTCLQLDALPGGQAAHPLGAFHLEGGRRLLARGLGGGHAVAALVEFANKA